MVVGTLKRKITLDVSDHGHCRGKLNWMFPIMGTLQRKITLNVSDYGYLTEEMLHWMFLKVV
jgi:hypothetical protein